MTEDNAVKAGSEERKDIDAADAAANSNNAANAPIKLDNVGLFIPDAPASMMKKPQLIIQRDGKANPSELYHEQLSANEPCKLMQGYVLVQTALNDKCNYSRLK